MTENLQKKYLDKIFQDLSLKSLSEEDKQEVLQNLSGRFSNVILILLLKSLSEKQKTKLSAVIKQSPAQLEKEVEQAASEIPGFKEAVDSALAREYEEIVRALNS